MANEIVYGDGTNSSIGTPQYSDFFYQRKALVEARKTEFFGQLSSVIDMPKHHGKTIKRYHYLPLLSDANINDQGIDANGLTVNYKSTMIFQAPDTIAAGNGDNLVYVIGEGNSAANAITAAKVEGNVVGAFARLGYGLTWTTNYATTVTALIAAGWKVSDDANDTIANTVYKVPVFDGGNFYGSSKDVGLMTAKLPLLSETGGRVNRVGFKRVNLEGSMEELGFFDEYTKDSMQFDSDPEMHMHVNRSMLDGAFEMSEAALQMDLLNSPGVIRYGGVATKVSELTGEGANISIPEFEDFMKINIDLDNNRTPKDTTLISGTRLTDTKTIQGARFMYIGSELITTVKKMKSIDPTSAAGSGFTSIEKYAAGAKLAIGEIGSIDATRIIVVPEMAHWAGAGGAVTTNPGYRETGGNYDVFPMLIVGKESFTTIGFQTNKGKTKFNIKHMKPGQGNSYSTADPFGKKGFMSISWWYGFMPLRTERIAIIKCVAPY